MQSIEDRLALLEARNAILERTDRRWRKVGLISCVFAGAGMLMGQAALPKPAPIAATTLTIVDKEGRPRIVIGADQENAGIVVIDDKGVQRISIGEGKNNAQGDGTGISLFDTKGRPRLSIGANDGGSGIVQLDAEGRRIRSQ